MHELSITQSLFDIVITQANQSGAHKVTSINLVIGAMSGIVGDSVSFYLDFLSKGTIVEGATLNIKMITTRALCRDCSKEFDLREFDWYCPACNSDRLEITGGKELFIESIEVE